jgi:hypothetical protein
MRQTLRLLVRMWGRDWSEELAESYFAWRYGAHGSGETLLSCDRGQCVRILDSLIRPYWLPRLKLGSASRCGRLTLRVLARTAAVARRLWPRSVASGRSIRLVRLIPRKPPPSANVCALRKDEELPRIAPYVLAPGLKISILDWLACAPSLLREFVLLSFFCNSEPVGVSISRVQLRPFGFSARVVHLHAAPFEVIDWIGQRDRPSSDRARRRFCLLSRVLPHHGTCLVPTTSSRLPAYSF